MKECIERSTGRHDQKLTQTKKLDASFQSWSSSSKAKIHKVPATYSEAQVA